jgi:hypothetical protein
MRLTTKWLLWFGFLGIYVMCLGGIFYYNLFKWTFDERLKQDSLTLVRNWAPLLQKSLDRSPWAPTLDDLDIMNALSRDERVTNLLYLNKDGTIRWFKDTTLWSASFDDYTQKFGAPKTDAIRAAYASKSPKILLVPGGQEYEVAVPLSRQKGGSAEVLGLINIHVSRASIHAVIRGAMNKYILGAIGVLVLIGGPLYFFLHHFILSPLGFLRDGIESVTIRTLDLKLPVRKDEIGELGSALNSLFAKLKGEMEGYQSRETERMAAEEKWWANILKVMAGSQSQAIVMDEDNTVLYTNFDLKAQVEAGQKVHLLDVVDTQQQELLQLAGRALEAPNELIEGETSFRGIASLVRIMHLAGMGPHRRTLILFEPRRRAAEGLGGVLG